MNSIIIPISSNSKSSSQIKIFDISGRLVYEDTVELEIGLTEVEISNVNLTSGIYILNVSNDSSSDNYKFVNVK